MSILESDSIAVNNIVAVLTGQLRADRIRADLEQMKINLDQDDSGPYEMALTLLGKYLGAAANKPAGQGRCDSAWRWDMAMWLAIEAKSEEHSDGLLPLKDIRQANTQMDQLASDLGVDHAPAGSPTILISDRLTVDPEHAPVANASVYLASTEVVRQIAGDTAAVWNDLLAAASISRTLNVIRQHVQTTLVDNGCLPSQVLDRLMQDRIRPGE